MARAKTSWSVLIFIVETPDVSSQCGRLVRNRMQLRVTRVASAQSYCRRVRQACAFYRRLSALRHSGLARRTKIYPVVDFGAASEQNDLSDVISDVRERA